MFNRSSHLTQEAIALYVDALKLDKTGQLPDDMLDHVAECERCKTEIAELFSLLEGEEYDRGEMHPYFDTLRHKRSRGPWPVYRYAAILVIGTCVGLLVYYFNAFKSTQKAAAPMQSSGQIRARDDNATKAGEMSVKSDIHQRDEYASNFIESPNLESLVGNELRSGAIQLVSPINGEVVRDTILFDWKGDGRGPFVLKVLTNREKVLFSRPTSSLPLELHIPLEPGLYYWKVESDGELQFVGKFQVR